VVWRNRLFRKDPGLSFQLDTHVYTLNFEPGDVPPPATDGYRAMVRMDERIGITVIPEEKLLAMMLVKIVSLEGFGHLPEDIRGVALEAALESLLERIDHFSGAHSTIVGVCDTPTPETPVATLGFRLTRTQDGAQCRGWIQSDAVGLDWLTARVDRLPGKRFRTFSHLPLTARIEIGRVKMSFTEMDSLSPLDILLPEGGGALGEREVQIHCGQSLTLAGRLAAPDRVLIQNIISDNGVRLKMPPSRPATAAPQESNLSDIPVTLVFEIGQTQLTMGELSQLQPGYTFQLSEPLDIDRPVTIRANGVAVGRGDIVQIDDTLGIRIHDFNDNSASAAGQ
jgi:type III secretion system YscQ/HrcQ family protein